MALLVSVLLQQSCWLLPELYGPILDRLIELDLNFSEGPFVVFFLYFTFINSLVEELFWRAFLLDRCGTGRISVLAQSIAYASYHFWVVSFLLPTSHGRINIWAPACATVMLTVFGGLMAFVYRKHGIFVAWSLHAVVDAVVCFFFANLLYDLWTPDC